MTYAEKVAYLKRYRIETETLKRLQNERAAVYATGYGGMAFGAQRSGAAPVDKVQKTVEKLYDLDAEIALAKERQTAARRATTRALEQVDDENMRRYLAYYYLEGMTWNAVADCAGYCREHMSRLHKKVLMGTSSLI